MESSFISPLKLTSGAPPLMPLRSLMSPRRRVGEVITMQGSTRRKMKMKMKIYNNKKRDDDNDNDDDEQKQQRYYYRRSHNYNNLVDENMIVLRMRIKEMKMLESRRNSEGEEENAPSNWTVWEKKYFGRRYNEDVCETVGLLQSFLMNTRPSLAVGLLALIATSVPVSASFVIFNAFAMLKNCL